MIDVGFVAGIRQSANMVADGLGVKCTDCVLAEKRVVLAEEDIVLPTSGLLVAAGTVAGIEWTWAATADGEEFLRVTNQQTAALGLGPGWRDRHEDPAWTVEIDGEPPIVATFGWPPGFPPGESTSLLNVSRAMNTIPASSRRVPATCPCSTSPRSRRAMAWRGGMIDPGRASRCH